MSDERGGRYFREARFFLAGDRVAAQSHIIDARGLLGYLRDQHALGGPAVMVKYATLKDGTKIKATMANGQFQAQIFSPSSGSKRERQNYEIYVRPPWTSTYDWIVAAEGCDAKTTHHTPAIYSNRMWQAPSRSIYCIVAGTGQTDNDKYFGKRGTTISKDGQTLYAAPIYRAIAGVAEFHNKVVVVQEIVPSTPNTLTPPRAQVQYEVLVNGVVKLTTPIFDAFVDDGYAFWSGYHLDGNGAPIVEFKFCQDIVVFSGSGAEAACVLGNATVLKFALQYDAATDAVSVTYALSAIPGAVKSYQRTVTTTTDGSSVATYTGTPGNGNPFDTNIVFSQSRVAKTDGLFTVALACDYVDDTLVYLLLDNGSDAGAGATVAETMTGTYHYWSTDGSTNNLNDTTTYSKDYGTGQPINRLKWSTGDTIYEWHLPWYWATPGIDTVSVVGGGSTQTRTTITSGFATGLRILGLDIKRKFITFCTLPNNSGALTGDVFVGLIQAVIDGTYNGAAGGPTIKSTFTETSTATTYAATDAPYTVQGGFAPGHNALNAPVSPTPSPVVTASTPAGLTGPWSPEVSPDNGGHVVTTNTFLTPLSNDASISTRRIPLFPLDDFWSWIALAQPVDYRWSYSRAMAIPDGDGLWNRALVFVSRPDVVLDPGRTDVVGTNIVNKSFVVCTKGATDVTTQFTEYASDGVTVAHPTATEHTTDHLGIIYKFTERVF